MKAYDNKTALLKTVLKTVMDPPLVALKYDTFQTNQDFGMGQELPLKL